MTLQVTLFRFRIHIALALGLALVAAGPIPSVRAEARAADDALSGFRQADYPTSLSGLYLAAKHADRINEMAHAAEFYLEAIAADPDNVDLVAEALPSLIASGRIVDAVGVAEQHIEDIGENRLANLLLGIDKLRSREYASARGYFSDARSGTIAGLVADLLVAWTHAGSGDTDRALEVIDNIAGQDWYASFTQFHAGAIAEIAGRHDEARRRFKAAYDADQKVLRVTQAYAEALSRDGRFKEAIALYGPVIERVPDHPLVEHDIKLLKSGKALPPLISNAQQGAAHVLYDLGSAIGRNGGEELSAIYLQLALYLHAESDLANFSLAGLYERLGQHQLAITVYERIGARSPLKRSAEIQVGLNLEALKRRDEADARLSALVDADPSRFEAVIAYGDTLRGRKQFARAAEIYSRGIAAITEPREKHWQLFYFRGICYERTGQWDKAEADFKRALELKPEQPLVLNYLGYSWVDQGMNYDAALAMIKKAVELKPEDGYIVDSLGWVYYKLGRYEEAVRTLERAVTLRPDDPLINDHLGDAYWRAGRRLEARFQWTHARDLKPEPEDLPRILKKLEGGLDAVEADTTRLGQNGARTPLPADAADVR